MKLTKKGTKRYKELYTIHIYGAKCHECGAEFELQSGEMGREECGGYHTLVCPYCHKFHSNYGFTKLRDEEVEWKDVVGYDCLQNPHRTVEY